MGFRLFRAAEVRPREEKASAAGPLMAFHGTGRAVWSPRDYASLTRNGYEQNVIGFRSVRMVAESGGGTLVINDTSSDVKSAAGVWGDIGSGYDLMKRIKSGYDPLNILNPGRLV